MSDAHSIEVRIAGRHFTLACSPDERADLEAAVAMVTERVDEAYSQSSNSSTERLLLLAALNIAHDLRRIRNVRGSASPAAAFASSAQQDEELRALREQIDRHLSK